MRRSAPAAALEVIGFAVSRFDKDGEGRLRMRLESVIINQSLQKLHHFVESFSGALISIWLNDEGNAVKEESPSGFVFRKEFKAMAMDRATPDLLAVEALANGTN